MAEKIITGGWSYPYASNQGDRRYSEADFALFFGLFFSRGIVGNMEIGSGLQVRATNPPSLQVLLAPGAAVCGDIERRGFYNSSTKKITLDAPLSNQTRTDSIVIRHSAGDRQSYPVYKPNDTRVIRTASVYEIKICDIVVPAKDNSISQSNIRDTRADDKVCGFSSPYGRMNAGSLYAQFEDQITSFLNLSKAEFTTWFNNLKAQLAGNVATNLQNQIDKLIAEGQPIHNDKVTDWDIVKNGVDVCTFGYFEAVGDIPNAPYLGGGYIVHTTRLNAGIAMQVAYPVASKFLPRWRVSWGGPFTPWNDIISNRGGIVSEIKVKDLEVQNLTTNSFGKRVAKNVPIGYGMTATFTRIGYQVFVNTDEGSITGNMPAGTFATDLLEKIPVGFRPSLVTAMVVHQFFTDNKGSHYDFHPNGDLQYFGVTLKKGDVPRGSVTYFTDEPMPKQEGTTK